MGQDFAEEVLLFMRNKLREYQEETGNLYNLEATPAEGATYRFAKEDQKIFPGIIQAGTPEAPYYTNSSQIPVEHTGDALKRWSFKTNCRLNTPAEQSFIFIWEKESATPNLAASWSKQFWKIIICLTSPSLRPSPFAPSTAT